MNYLAHFHLSHGDDDLLLGALLGDYVKGPLRGERRESLEQGILLHRKIDAFTDNHAAVKQSHLLFAPKFRRFAGIMTDVLFDHFLTIHWHTFHHQTLPTFSDEIYDLLKASDALTEGARIQANNLSQYRVFEAYIHWHTVDAALTRIGQRLKRENPLVEASTEMQRHYRVLEDTFLEFYPDLQLHAASTRAQFGRKPGI